MKVIKGLKKVLAISLGSVFFVFAIIMTILLLNINQYGVTQFDDTAFILIKEDILEGKYKKGDLVIVENKRIDKMLVGDEIFVYKVLAGGRVSIDVGIVGELYVKEEEFAFENGAGYSAKYIAGTAKKVYDGLGGYLSIIQSRWGFLFIVLIPSFMIFVHQLYALIIELKYGKYEN